DRRTDVPVRAQRLSEQLLSVDGEPRGIIWSIGENGVTTFLVNGSTRGVRNRERRVALAKATGLLEQLTSSLMPLRARGAEPELVVETLQLLVMVRFHQWQLSGVAGRHDRRRLDH